MQGIICDRCDKSLLIDEDVRYEVRIVVQAAYDPMEITAKQLADQRPIDWQNLIKNFDDLTEEELQDQVYRELRFDLCPGCQKEYLKDPLPESGG
ncbi:MAG TPA: hypothetical protein EYN79_09405 [Planctomycetes bacterium]|nr:hypothetical protein [Planctomycetota bacterium]